MVAAAGAPKTGRKSVFWIEELGKEMPIVQEFWLNFYILLYFLPFHPKGSARNRELCYNERGLNSERTQLFWPKDQDKRPLEARKSGPPLSVIITSAF